MRVPNPYLIAAALWSCGASLHAAGTAATSLYHGGHILTMAGAQPAYVEEGVPVFPPGSGPGAHQLKANPS